MGVFSLFLVGMITSLLAFRVSFAIAQQSPHNQPGLGEKPYAMLSFPLLFSPPLSSPFLASPLLPSPLVSSPLLPSPLLISHLLSSLTPFRRDAEHHGWRYFPHCFLGMLASTSVAWGLTYLLPKALGAGAAMEFYHFEVVAWILSFTVCVVATAQFMKWCAKRDNVKAATRARPVGDELQGIKNVTGESFSVLLGKQYRIIVLSTLILGCKWSTSQTEDVRCCYSRNGAKQIRFSSYRSIDLKERQTESELSSRASSTRSCKRVLWSSLVSWRTVRLKSTRWVCATGGVTTTC